ncbi:hypothetical protein [Pseudomonas saliphila]|uniref:hypothetical protein n=1 Tax=Pseudomonas saliphila TaxID=2586906 RepID=UPI0015B3A16D|nr:hypothetical protein [Pseudomonas saliphila]
MSGGQDESSRGSSWRVLNLGDPLLADQRLTQVLDAASSACLNAAPGADMAVFQRHESEGRLHCELKLYFSPALDELARSYGARRCRPPTAHDMSQVAGCEQAAQRLLSQE